MKTCCSKRGWLSGAFVALAVLGAGAVASGQSVKNDGQARPIRPASGEVPVAGQTAAIDPVLISTEPEYARSVFPIGTRNTPRVDRGSPNLGGGCQVADNGNGFNYTAFFTADNFNPSVSGTITGISWSAAYRAGNCAAGPNCPGTAGSTPFFDGTPPANETFQIRFYNDAGGVPGTQVGSTIVVNNPLRADSGFDLAGGLSIYDYTATIAGPAVNAGQCYWLEIRNTSVLPGGAGTNVSFWVQANDPTGDLSFYQAFVANCGTVNPYTIYDAGFADVTWCLNIQLNDLSSNPGGFCPIPSPPTPTCNTPANNGQGNSSASNTGYTSVSAGSVYTGAGRFQRAEKFQLQNGGSVNQVCFWGFFAQQVAGGKLYGCDEVFDIIFWNDDQLTGAPGTQLATRTVGQNGVSIQRGIDALGNDSYTVTFPPGQEVALMGNQCYHITISHPLTTGNLNRQAVFVWGAIQNDINNPVLNDTFFSRTISTTGVAGAWQVTTINPNTNNQPLNLSYLLGFTSGLGGPVVPLNCPLPPPANDTCAGAGNLEPFGTVLTNQRNSSASPDALPGCGFDLNEGPAVWYTFLGNGNDITITTSGSTSAITCATATGFDTVMHVYCSENGCNGPFNCVAGNDDFDCDANPATANLQSQVTIGTVAGTRYYVSVHGFGGSEGAFSIRATSGAASVAPPTCASLAQCVLDSDPSDFAEADLCGVDGNDTNNTCGTATTYPNLGDIGAGRLGTAQSQVTGFDTRDIDFYRLPASASGQNVVVSVNAESPVVVQFLNDAVGDCATLTVVPNSTFFLTSCIGLDVLLFEVTLPAGNNYFLITLPSFDGNPCGMAANSQNDYRIQIDLTPTGACCVDEFTACSVQTIFACFDGGGQTFFPGLGCSLGAGMVDPCTVTSGACCLPDNTCQFVPSANVPTQTDCETMFSGTFIADGVCTPNPCSTPTTGACCCGSSCTITTAAACTGANRAFAGPGTSCTPFSNTVPCCRADYNKTGAPATVQDIFDFLGGYFSSDACADSNDTGGAPTVQDIFDFLGAYFGGGC